MHATPYTIQAVAPVSGQARGTMSMISTHSSPPVLGRLPYSVIRSDLDSTIWFVDYKGLMRKSSEPVTAYVGIFASASASAARPPACSAGHVISLLFHCFAMLPIPILPFRNPSIPLSRSLYAVRCYPLRYTRSAYSPPSHYPAMPLCWRYPGRCLDVRCCCYPLRYTAPRRVPLSYCCLAPGLKRRCCVVVPLYLVWILCFVEVGRAWRAVKRSLHLR